MKLTDEVKSKEDGMKPEQEKLFQANEDLIDEIKKLISSRDGAQRAHQIGSILRDILTEKKWKDLGYHTRTAFLSSLGVTRATSYNYLRIARLLSLADCEGLTQDSALLLCRIRSRRRRQKLAARLRDGAFSFDDLRRLVRGEALRV
jgi:hypothetical protein